MDNLTNLEKTVLKIFQLKNPADLKCITQKELDAKTKAIISLLKPRDIIKHTKTVYDRTAKIFDQDSHIQGIVDELVIFINLLNDEDLVLDLGCGNGRDTLFMVSSDTRLKRSMMQRIADGKKTIEKYPVPEKILKVVALDSSLEMLNVAQNKIIKNRQSIKNFPTLIRKDMHNLDNFRQIFNGIWSCTSLLVHPPKELMKPAINSCANLLLPKGKFYLSYISGKNDDEYDKLLISSTGHIKYFSHPDPKQIRAVAEKYGLKEIFFIQTDFTIGNKLIKEDFFTSHIFEKRR